MKIEELKSRLAKVEDPRGTDRENIRHKLEDIIIIGLCTLICDGDDFADMEEFGIQRQDVLSQFLELPNEIPDSDTFRGVFEQLNPEALSEYLYDCFPATAKKVLLLQWTGKQSAVAATKVIKPIISKISLVTKEKGYGRIEKREYRLLKDLSWLPEAEVWDSLCSVGMVKSTVSRAGKTSTEKRCYISFLSNLNQFAYAVQKHWSIENQLH